MLTLFQNPIFLGLFGVALYLVYAWLRRFPQTFWWKVLRTMVCSTAVGSILAAFTMPPMIIVALCVGATIVCFHITVELLTMVVNRPR
jgi:hypothetical protein